MDDAARDQGLRVGMYTFHIMPNASRQLAHPLRTAPGHGLEYCPPVGRERGPQVFVGRGGDEAALCLAAKCRLHPLAGGIEVGYLNGHHALGLGR
jgi:hypothetical protein